MSEHDAVRAGLQRERAELDSERAALTAERERLTAEREQLRRERAAFEAQRRTAREETRASQPTDPAPGRRTSSPRVVPRWRELDDGAFACTVGAATTRGEHELLRQPWPEGWLVVSGLEVSDRTRTREIDLLVIAPGGLLVVEQKDTRARGTLLFATNGSPTVDGQPLPSLGGALRQARLPAQMLGATLKEAGVRAGYIGAVLAIRGQVRISQTQVGATYVAESRSLVRAATQLLEPDDAEQTLPVGTVLAVLTHLGLPLAGVPALQTLGFSDSSW